MKKILLLFLFIVSLSAKGQTNVYHPFPDSDAVWTYDYVTIPGLEQHVWIYQDYINGDTIIGSYTYQKIYGSSLFQSFGFPCCGQLLYPPQFYYAGFKGGLRQDTANKKIYWYDIKDHRDTLLYNFNLSIGDTIPKSFLHSSPDVIFVESIDSFFDGSIHRKRYNLSNDTSTFHYSYVSLIEGIGSTFGLLADIGWMQAGRRDLNCFMQDGIIKYRVINSQWSTCNWLTVNDIDKEVQFAISLSPNPFHTAATLTTNFQIPNSNCQLRIYDVMGRLVKEHFIYGQTAIINRENLANGIYFVRVNVEEKQFVQRIIVE